MHSNTEGCALHACGFPATCWASLPTHAHGVLEKPGGRVREFIPKTGLVMSNGWSLPFAQDPSQAGGAGGVALIRGAPIKIASRVKPGPPGDRREKRKRREAESAEGRGEEKKKEEKSTLPAGMPFSVVQDEAALPGRGKAHRPFVAQGKRFGSVAASG